MKKRKRIAHWTKYGLQFNRPQGGGEIFLPFKDKASGAETFPERRYLYIEPMPGGNVFMDFNRAPNLFFVYGGEYICPYAFQKNWIDIPIRAGEKGFR